MLSQHPPEALERTLGRSRQFCPQREALAPGHLETELDLRTVVAAATVEEVPQHDFVRLRDIGLVGPAFETTVDAELTGRFIEADAVVNEADFAISELDPCLLLRLGERKGDTEALGVGLDRRQLEAGEKTRVILVEVEGDRGMIHD